MEKSGGIGIEVELLKGTWVKVDVEVVKSGVVVGSGVTNFVTKTVFPKTDVTSALVGLSSNVFVVGRAELNLTTSFSLAAGTDVFFSTTSVVARLLLEEIKSVLVTCGAAEVEAKAGGVGVVFSGVVEGFGSGVIQTVT